MCNFSWCKETQPYYKCCLNWDFSTCSSFVRLLFFFQVHAAKTSNIKIKLFFAYRIGNNLYRKEQSLYPQNLHPILKRQIQHFPSTYPHSPVSSMTHAVTGGHGGMAACHFTLLPHFHLLLSLWLAHFVHKAARNWVFDKEVFTSSVSCA